MEELLSKYRELRMKLKLGGDPHTRHTSPVAQSCEAEGFPYLCRCGLGPKEDVGTNFRLT